MVETLDQPISDEQRQRLEQALLARKRAQPQATMRAGSDLGMPQPLSQAQLKIWLHETLDDAGGLYNMPCALRLHGPLDVEALRRAIELHVHRHAILRSCIADDGGQPRLVCQAPERIELPILQMTDEDEAARWIRSEADVPFDLARAPLLRGHLLCHGAERHTLLLTLHHIASDGWSVGVMVREISQAYLAFSRGEASPLAPLAYQYADYGAWQREWLTDARVQQQLSFWVEQLQDAPALLPLPVEMQRPATQRHEGGTFRFRLDSQRTERLRSFCRAHNATPYMCLLALFNVLLSRYSGSDDIVVGSPVANRFPRETEALVGFFVNMLAMRNRPSPELPFADFLQQVKQRALAAYAHQDVPFDLVVEHLKPERSTSHSPLFQVEFVLQQAMPQHLALGRLNVEPLVRDSSYTKFDLTLSLQEGADEMLGLIEYDSQLFSPAFAQRMAGHYLTLLDSALDDAAQPIHALRMLTAAEEATLAAWSNMGGTRTVERHMLDHFADRVALRPDAIAVQHNDERMSYRQLDQHANRLAHALAQAGVAAHDRIALYLDRGVDYVAAMLASFKLGAVFVPFNPKQSPVRNARMLDRAAPAAILAGPGYAEGLAAIAGAIPVLPLHRDALQALPDTWAQPPAADLDDTAYIIFTSGSTGEPKGAMVAHRGMVNHLLAKIDDLELGPADVVAQIAVQTFDVAVWQCLAALLVGGRTEVLTGADAWEPVPLLEQLRLRQISVVETVPSHLEILLDETARQAGRHALPTLRWMISNGEPLASALAARWFGAFPSTRLMNAYGPTECSDDVTHLCLDGPPARALPYLPIGRPIANAQLHVLDARMQKVPVGVVGEIHIGGPCVGNGYFNDDAKTQASFVADTFTGMPGTRLYKTGDLGRYRADGTLEMLGRRDFQLKIRGCRIEAGEVEAALRAHPAVEQCLVMGSQDRLGRTQLAAYVISPQRPAPSAAALQAFCRQCLPDFMVPSGICLLDDFPLLPNGKIDRAQLPPLADFELGTTGEYIAPRTDAETHLAAIWAAVLGVERVGVADSFFELGGHSLLAVELVAQCRPVLGETLTLALLFQHPTIEALSLAIEAPCQEAA